MMTMVCFRWSFLPLSPSLLSAPCSSSAAVGSAAAVVVAVVSRLTFCLCTDDHATLNPGEGVVARSRCLFYTSRLSAHLDEPHFFL